MYVEQLVEVKGNKSLAEEVLLYYDPLHLEHLTLPHHPDQPKRLTTIVEHLQKYGIWDIVTHRSCREIQLNDKSVFEYITLVHPEQHIDYIKRKSEEARQSNAIIMPFSDGGDTNVSANTFEVAQKTVAAAIEMTAAVCRGEVKRSFCTIRPPGHHCERNRPMGFCVFNNVAIATRYAQQVHGVDRIAIIDWDVHHGNGTQAIFYDDPSVLYISLHQYPHYPGTGSTQERGSGDAEGTTMNFPLAAGTDEKKYEQVFVQKIVPAIKEFEPGLIFISAGFDAHRGDPLGDMLLTGESFGIFTRILSDATAVCDGRIVSLLEGGYNLQGLAESVAAHILALGGVEQNVRSELKGNIK